jgi:hypothetical protein
MRGPIPPASIARTVSTRTTELPFQLTGAPGQAREFDFEIAAHLPADALLLLVLPPAAAAGLPAQRRERIGRAGRRRWCSRSRGCAAPSWAASDYTPTRSTDASSSSVRRKAWLLA